MFLEIYLIISSIYDIRTRTIPTPLMIIAYILAIIGIIYNHTLICIIPVIVWLSLTIVNAQRIKRNKPVIIGGADIVTYLAIGCIYPNPVILIGVPAGALVLSTLLRLIPKVNQSFTEKGVPYIPFMGVITVIYAITQVI